MKFATVPRTGVVGAALCPPGAGGVAMDEDDEDAGGERKDASILDGAEVGGWGGVEGGVSMMLLFSISDVPLRNTLDEYRYLPPPKQPFFDG